jgi:uncharacterized membrane protein
MACGRPARVRPLPFVARFGHHHGMSPSPPAPRASLHFQRYFVTGILTLLPIWLTFVVFKFVFGLLSGFSAPWISAITAQVAAAAPPMLGWIDDEWARWTIALLATILLIYLIGLAASRVFGQRILGALEALLARIPLAQTIYGGVKKLIELVKTKPDGTQRVVLVDFPHREMKAVGLVTRVLRDVDDGREYAAVYVPTTPNPTSGYLEVVPVERLTPTDWTLDQAMAFIISGGAMAPEAFRFNRKPGEAAVDGPTDPTAAPKSTP